MIQVTIKDLQGNISHSGKFQLLDNANEDALSIFKILGCDQIKV